MRKRLSPEAGSHCSEALLGGAFYPHTGIDGNGEDENKK